MKKCIIHIMKIGKIIDNMGDGKIIYSFTDEEIDKEKIKGILGIR